MKKTRLQKSHATVPLSKTVFTTVMNEFIKLQSWAPRLSNAHLTKDWTHHHSQEVRSQAEEPLNSKVADPDSDLSCLIRI